MNPEPDLSPSKAASLGDEVTEALRVDLLTWRYPPDTILTEAKVASRFRVSKTPAREALRRLVQEGFLEVVPRVGYRVTPVRIADVHEVFHLRALLEGEAAALAAVNATEADLARLKDNKETWIRYLSSHRTEPLVYLKYHDAFHLAIASLSGNTRLADMIGKLLRESTRIRLSDPLMSLKGLEEEQLEADEILRALKKHDSEAARKRMRDHIMESKERILEQLTGRSNLSI